MKELWIQIKEGLDEHVKKGLAKKISEQCDVLVVREEDLDLYKNFGFARIASPIRGDIKLIEMNSSHQDLKGDLKNIAVRIRIKGRSDEEIAENLAAKGVEYIIAVCPDWKIIPLENLIAKTHKYPCKLIASVSSYAEAKTALETLELGVDGILLLSNQVDEISETSQLLQKSLESLNLVEAKVINIKPLSTGARACVDTTSLMDFGEGLLVGSQSSGLFLVQAEVQVNPHVEPRPFRVNAGPVSSYILTPKWKTRYLSELKTGDEVLIVDKNGIYRNTNIGRIKIELRPLLLIEAKYSGRKFRVILQNAETIHLITKEGSKSVYELKPGDKILIRFEEGGRHFGLLVEDETVIER